MPGDDDDADVDAIGEQRAVALPCRAVAAVVATRCRLGLDEEEDGGGEHDEPVDGEHDEDCRASP